MDDDTAGSDNCEQCASEQAIETVDVSVEKRKNNENRQASNGKGKSKSRQRKSQLGKPVKRENPNRTDNKTEMKMHNNNAEVSENTNITVSDADQKNSWANAIEKAIQAINQE